MNSLSRLSFVAGLAALLLLGNTVAQAQQSKKTVHDAVKGGVTEVDDDADPATPNVKKFQVGRPAWTQVERTWEAADETAMIEDLQVAKQAEATFIAFAKLDGGAPCATAASCKSWYGSLDEAGRGKALTRLMDAMVSGLSGGYDRSELEEMGIAEILKVVEENRAVLAVANLRRYVLGVTSDMAGVLHNTTPTDVGNVAAAQRRALRAAELAEAASDRAFDARGAATTANLAAAEQGISAAVKSVRDRRAAALAATAEKAEAAATATSEAETAASEAYASARRQAGLDPAAAATAPPPAARGGTPVTPRS